MSCLKEKNQITGDLNKPEIHFKKDEPHASLIFWAFVRVSAA
jgi:hypothetical protein|tara:strand:+ start:382 stop:507 length:126 start_codon:yes stop_codon:yes gene_type:complete